MRWQDEQREEMKKRLNAKAMETGFEDEDEGEEEVSSEEDGFHEERADINDIFQGRM